MSPRAVRRRTLLHRGVALALTPWSSARAQQRLPIFDAHVHYSHDAVELVPPKPAVQILRQAGLKGVFVSSSDDDTNTPASPALRRSCTACFTGTSSTASWL